MRAPDVAHCAAAQLCREEGTTLESLQAALAAFDRQYTATAVGPAKWKRHAEFMRDSYAACVRDLAQRSNQRAAAEAAAAVTRAQQAQAALRQVHPSTRTIFTCPSTTRTSPPIHAALYKRANPSYWASIPSDNALHAIDSLVPIFVA